VRRVDALREHGVRDVAMPAMRVWQAMQGRRPRSFA
jgi:hypothetical protein